MQQSVIRTHYTAMPIGMRQCGALNPRNGVFTYYGHVLCWLPYLTLSQACKLITGALGQGKLGHAHGAMLWIHAHKVCV